MNKYQVRVWISDIEIEADNPRDAEKKALSMVENAEYAEAIMVLKDGRFKYISTNDRS